MAFLSKELFSSYQFNPPGAQQSSQPTNEEDTVEPFAISMPALLETLQIFGLNDASKPNPWNRDAYSHDAFSAQVLGVIGICRLRYEAPGMPLTIVLEEPGISTTCDLVTYEPSVASEIPFSRTDIAMKIIMGASHLSDAIAEMSSSSPDQLTITATNTSLMLSATGGHGSAIVHFKRDSAPEHSTSHAMSASDGKAPSTAVLESFLVDEEGFNQAYKFSHISTTKKALSSAIKVSIRGDLQGVLSLQFMIENIEGQGVSFVDYRFIPLVREAESELELPYP
jgi:cell cycle checkpoint protein